MPVSPHSSLRSRATARTLSSMPRVGFIRFIREFLRFFRSVSVSAMSPQKTQWDLCTKRTGDDDRKQRVDCVEVSQLPPPMPCSPAQVACYQLLRTWYDTNGGDYVHCTMFFVLGDWHKQCSFWTGTTLEVTLSVIVAGNSISFLLSRHCCRWLCKSADL